MTVTQHIYHHFSCATISWMKLMMLWLSGLFVGFRAAGLSPNTLVLLLTITPFTEPRFATLVFLFVFSLLLRFLCFTYRFDTGLLMLCFIRGMLIGFLLGGISVSFSGATLLFSVLLMFTALSNSVVFLWYSCRRMTLRKERLVFDTLAVGCVGLIIATVDTILISPYLADIVIY